MLRGVGFAIAGALALAWSGAVTPVEAAGEKTTEIKDKAADTAREARDRLKSAGQKVKEKLVDVKDEVKAKLRRAEQRSGAAGAADVREAQEALEAKGFHPGPIDGVMGPRTSAAVRDFQRRNGLPVTGRLDGATASRLGLDTRTGSAQAPSASPATGRTGRPTR